MKEVVYPNHKGENKVFLLTDKEFNEAQLAWHIKKQDYHCQRLDAVLSKTYRWIETPSEDIGYEVFVRFDKGELKKVFKRGDDYFLCVGGEGGGSRYVKVELEKEMIKQLIPQEDYYQERKYLLIN